jgi:acyl-CoA synthetase (AMP-forming)/AMP-acid ligase II
MIYLGDIPMLNASRFPDTEAVVFEETRLKWPEFNGRINRLANGLVSMGFKKGDHIAVLSENCHQYMEIYYALAKAGMVTVPLNYRLSERELTYIIDHSEAAGMMVGKKYLELAGEMRPELGRIREYISIEEDAEGMTPYDDVLGMGDVGEPDWELLDENDMVILMYTGGTTGMPKGVMISHRNLLSALMGIAITQRSMVLPGLRTLFALPFFHIANWQPFFFHMMGGCVVINRDANAENVVRLIIEEKTVVVNLVPTVYQNMLEVPGIEKMNFRHVASFSVAGAPMAPEVMKKCIGVFGLKVRKGYGLTEAASAVSSLDTGDFAMEGDPKLVKRGESVGRETINARVKIRREDGSECDTGEAGEITVYGKNVMLGYWKNEEQTGKLLRDGWLWTGDIGYKDEDGFIFLVDRKGDMIISGGENVYPNEVEDVLYQHPAVLEAAAFGAPHEKWGEAVMAAVALKPGEDASEEEIIAFCRERLAGYKTPRAVYFADELPKSTVGKVLRRALKERYGGGAGQAEPDP